MFKDLINEKNYKALNMYLEHTHSFDLAQDFLSLTNDEKNQILSLINHEKLADICTYLDPEEAKEIIEKFDLEKQTAIVDFMEPDDAADMIQTFDDQTAKILVDTLEDAEDISKLLSYEENETGSIMTNAIVTLKPDMDIKSATKYVIKQAPEVETIHTLFVIDEEQLFLGVVKLRNLLKARPSDRMVDLIEDSPYIKDHEMLMKAIQLINQYGMFEMPVCNEKNQLLGVITLDDALDAYQDEAQEDFEKLAALPETIDAKPYKIALHRMPWLLLLLFVSIPVSLLTNMFHEVISAVAIIVIFQPMISGAAGNVATQTLAITLRNFTNEEKQNFSDAKKEVITGLFIGIIIGMTAFVVTYIFVSFQSSIVVSPMKMATIVALALIVTVLFAPIIAILIPTVLKLFHIDPAVASGPLITTLLDMTTVSIYFGLATLLIGVI